MSSCNLERKLGQPQSQKRKGMLQVAQRGGTLSDDLAGGGTRGKKKVRRSNGKHCSVIETPYMRTLVWYHPFYPQSRAIDISI